MFFDFCLIFYYSIGIIKLNFIIIFMFKKIFLIIIFVASFLAINVQAVENKRIDLYFFYGDGCPHCAKEEIFLAKLEKEKSNISIHRYEVWHNKTNADLLSKVAKNMNVKVSGVPILFAGSENIVGYGSDESSGQDITKMIKYYEEYGCVDVIGPIINNTAGQDVASSTCATQNTNRSSITTIPEEIKLPFFGMIKTRNVSLPLLTVIVGTLDGFNPCAMWVLLFLISMLLRMEDRKRMWILGWSFIAASGAVYFFFMTAWLNLFMFIGFVAWIRLLIAVIALGGGAYQLYDIWKHRKGGCLVEGSEKRRAIFDKIRKVISEKNFILAMAGIILLAMAINLVELVCSIGLPAVYTQVLSMSHLPSWEYYAYLFLYIIFYMMEEIIVFVIAMITLRTKAFSTRHMKWTQLAGGIIMLVIGILLIFKPGWLMF